MTDNEAGTPVEPTDGADQTAETPALDAAADGTPQIGPDHPEALPQPPAAPAASDTVPVAPPPFTRPASTIGASQPRRTWVPVLAGIAIGAVLGGASGAGVAMLTQQGERSGFAVSGPQTITVNDYDETTLVSAVAAAAMPSVVTISVVGASASGTGSGVVIDGEGHIVTNTHVVTLGGAEAEPAIRVTTSSGRIYDAEIVGVDPLMDLAVIKVDGAAELVPIEFADSSALNVGDITIAIGAPLGLSGTVTSGIVSSLDRSIEVASSAVPGDSADAPVPDGGTESADPFDFFRFDIPDAEQGQGRLAASGVIQLAVIQTDTAINSGNSGGALLDADGRLIGINVAIATGGSGNRGNIGVGFAIPSNIAARVAAELIESGEASHGLLGVSVSNVADDPSQVDAVVIGASIVEIVSGGAADQAGLRVGDIIVALDDVPITSKTDITAQVRTHAAGSTVELGFVRGDQIRFVDVTLGDLADLLG